MAVFRVEKTRDYTVMPNHHLRNTLLSLKGKGKWVWNGGGDIGGVSALDYLVKVRGMGFVAAVEQLTGEYPALAPIPKAQSPPAPEKWRFYPPKPLHYSNGALSYLQHRGISPEIIARCMDAGILFESRYYNPQSPHHHAAVCVFAGKDSAGAIRFAAMWMRRIDKFFKTTETVLLKSPTVV